MPTKKEKQPLSVTHPELANQADGWDPSTATKGSHALRSWKCSEGHTWEASPNTRVGNARASSGNGCPFCNGKKVDVGINDLTITHPTIALQAVGWDPSKFTYGSKKRQEWQCAQGHKWIESIKMRTIGGRKKTGYGCPFCSNKRILIGFNDLASSHPNIASEADGWNPTTVSVGTTGIFSWKCPSGHRYTARLTDRTFKASGCPYCSNLQVLKGFNDLATTHPELAAEIRNIDPSTIVAGTNTKYWWECKLGHLWESAPHNRINSRGCPFCSSKKVLKGFNDLGTSDPELAKEAFNWDPFTIITGSSKKLDWKCSEGHVWSAAVSSRSNTKGKKRGCPTCAFSGFDPNAPAFLYFLRQPDWKMLQIGITNNFERRFAEHQKNQWELLEVRGPMDGHLTQQWERAILQMLKAKGADLSNSAIAGRFDGFSEAWSKSTFKADSIKELMRLTEEFEESTNRDKS